MNSPGRATSQTSESSSVVDLSCTYNLSQTVLLQEPSPRSWEEDFCSSLTSNSSFTSLRNTGSIKSSCEENKEQQLEEKEKPQIMPQSSDSFIVTQQSAATLNPLHRLKTTQSLNDAQIRESLDTFYEQSSWRGKNYTLSHQLSEKISDLSKKKHLYALRSFQLGKIVLNQEGEKILQNCSGNDLFSREETKNVEPVPGLSKDVVTFIMDQKKPHN
ncbi:shieldin complex subunit 1 isoform X2 [Rhinoderma darwinii]